MRHIGTLPDESQARTFEHYLVTQGIKADLERDGSEWSVWIHEEDDVDPAKAALDDFRAHPDASAFHGVSEKAAQLRRQAEKKNRQFRKNHIDMRERWQRPSGAAAPVTWTLIAVSVAVAFGTRLGDQHEPVENALTIASYEPRGNLIQWHGLEDVRQGEIWRLVTPIFLHYGVLHILFNMIWLYELGMAIEFRRGSLRYVLLILAIAVCSNLAQYAVGGPAFGGMSGVVYGLFGYIWMKSRFDPAAGLYMPPNTVFWLLGWFFLCMTGWVGPIANMAHGVGLAVGMAVGYAPRWWRQLAGG